MTFILSVLGTLLLSAALYAAYLFGVEAGRALTAYDFDEGCDTVNAIDDLKKRYTQLVVQNAQQQMKLDAQRQDEQREAKAQENAGHLCSK